MVERDYLFVESAVSLCDECLERVDAKIIIKEGKVFLSKFCKKHGYKEELLEEDAKYYMKRHEYDKPGNKIISETKVKKGCPFDCGLCPSHEQHSCNALIEVTSKCDLQCPMCYANSGNGKHLDLKKIEKMMDFFQERENNEAEILQISGGEPTTHPEILEIIKKAKEKNFRYVMLNTNGLRIARDEEFVRQLAKFKVRFEIYLQFDGFKEDTYKVLRGNENLLDIKMKAIRNLQKYGMPITLVATIEKGVNDDEIGKIINFAMNEPCIRGVNFQPIAFFGRISPKKDVRNRITLTGIINKIKEQTGFIEDGDIVPLPCDVDRVAVSYFYKKNGRFIPLTRHFKVQNYLSLIDNTFAFDAEKILQDKRFGIKNIKICKCFSSMIGSLGSLIPDDYFSMSDNEQIEYWNNNMFRISITSFLDKYNFDLKSAKKECVHFIIPELKRIPFSTYNLIHRKGFK
jgi:uncharacterized radical SAM superfamily Fe-S cluster-containing enzyme